MADSQRDAETGGSVVAMPRNRRPSRQQKPPKDQIPGVIYVGGKLKPCEHNAMTLIAQEDDYRDRKSVV